MPNQTGGRLRSLAVFTLCAVFFALAMGVTLLGSSVYRSAIASADQNFTHRTALSYLVNQVRRGDAAGAVAVGQLDGADAVALTEGDYVTYLYCRDGYLMELYTSCDSGLTEADGIPLFPLDSLSISLEDGRITFLAQGFSVTITPRCGAEEGGAL